MTLRHVGRYLSYLSLLGVAGLFISGCVINDPPAIGEIARARKALDDAKRTCPVERAPDKYSDLEKRYLQARGVFYACNDAEAIRLAQALVADANAIQCAAAAPVPTANRPPVARLTVQDVELVGQPVSIDASASTDPDGDALTYTFDFGDGSAPARLTVPRTQHSYAKAGRYTVKVTVDDGRGGTASATASTTITLRVVMSDRKGQTLFDFDKADLKPSAKATLDAVVQALKENPALGVRIVGHTDNKGSDAYNMKLSQRRADAVAAYLVSHGVDRNSITTEARGLREPVATNTTAEGRAQNRRVEITATPR